MLLTAPEIHADELAARTGWEAKPEGFCKGERCVPAPGAVRPGGRIDAAALADALAMPLVHDSAHGLWALGPESGGRALTSATAPELTLPDRDGNPFRLRALHGRKVLLVAWASW